MASSLALYPGRLGFSFGVALVFPRDILHLSRQIKCICNERHLSLSVAESCTGGLISEKITNTPGSSNYFLGGVVSYANSIKTSLLGVAADTITRQGAVSRVVAELMAKGIRNVSGSDIGLSVTGIAGPGGGTADKPVGTVYIGIATPKECWVNRFAFSGSRKQIRLQTAYSGLDLVRKYLLRDETSSFC